MNKIPHFLEILVALFFFVMMRPVFTWSWSPIVLVILTVLFMGILATHSDFGEKDNIGLFIFFLIMLAVHAFNSGANIIGSIPILMMVFIPFTKVSFAQKVYEFFEKIIVFITAVSVIIWFLVIVLGLNLPYEVVTPLNDIKEYDYNHYPFLLVPQLSLRSLTSTYKFHCIFDENGVVGTYSLMMLYLNNFNLSKFKNIVLLIAGIVSASLFFYIAAALFLVVKVFSTKEMNKYRIAVVASIAILFALLQNVPLFNEMIGVRLEYNSETKTLTGNNRSTEELSDYIDKIRGTSEYFWGDTKEKEMEFAASASLNNAILKYGVVFIVAYFLLFFLLALKKLKGQTKEILLFLLFMFLTLYQRPGLLGAHYLFLFICCIYSRIKPSTEKTFPLSQLNN